MICQHYLNVNGAESFFPSKSRACVVFIFLPLCLFLRPISNFSITMETERPGVISHKWCLNKLTTLKEKPVENSGFGARWGLQEIQVIIFYCSLWKTREIRDGIQVSFSTPYNLRVILLKTIKKRQSGVSNKSEIGSILKYLAVIMHLMAFHWLAWFHLSTTLEKLRKCKHFIRFYSKAETAMIMILRAS